MDPHPSLDRADGSAACHDSQELKEVRPAELLYQFRRLDVREKGVIFV